MGGKEHAIKCTLGVILFAVLLWLIETNYFPANEPSSFMSPISAREAKIDDNGEYVNRRSRPKIAADKEKNYFNDQRIWGKALAYSILIIKRDFFLLVFTVAAHSPDNFQKCCYLQVDCTTTETKDLSQDGRKKVRSKVYTWLDTVCNATVATSDKSFSLE